MGFFSWKTSDTDESIMNIHSGKCKPVFVYFPDGRIVEEPEYEGYGIFDGHDAYVELAKWNVPELIVDLEDEEVRMIGIDLCYLDIYASPSSGDFWVYGKRALASSMVPGVKTFDGDYQTPQPGFDGKTPNQLISDGTWVKLVKGSLIIFPLKFSFSKDKKYEDLCGAQDCPNQGYFDWSEDEEEEEEVEENYWPGDVDWVESAV